LSADAAGAVPRRTAHALDLLNFFLADVHDGLGPYLSIYLLLTHHWPQASIGFVMGVGGIAAIIAQTPVGAFVDRTTAKRAVVIAGAVTVTAGSLAMPLFPCFFAITILQALTGVAGSVFAPALAAPLPSMGRRRRPFEHRRRVDRGGRRLRRGVHLAGCAGRGGLSALVGWHARDRA
jgi:MFS family permease